MGGTTSVAEDTVLPVFRGNVQAGFGISIGLTTFLQTFDGIL